MYVLWLDLSAIRVRYISRSLVQSISLSYSTHLIGEAANHSSNHHPCMFGVAVREQVLSSVPFDYSQRFYPCSFLPPSEPALSVSSTWNSWPEDSYSLRRPVCRCMDLWQSLPRREGRWTDRVRTCMATCMDIYEHMGLKKWNPSCKLPLAVDKKKTSFTHFIFINYKVTLVLRGKKIRVRNSDQIKRIKRNAMSTKLTSFYIVLTPSPKEQRF
jgi:hypothetical protein